MLAERSTTVRWAGFDTQVLFEFRIERCLVTLTQGTDDLPAGHTIWHDGHASATRGTSRRS